MPITYLRIEFSQKDVVKALGARWDSAERKWYVPEGRDLEPFRAWLSEPQASTQVAVPEKTAAIIQVGKRGSTLSELLAGVANVVAQAYKGGVWTIVEVVQATLKGHVYLELAERDANGVVLAKARGMIWDRVAEGILPPFEAATGMSIGPGIKLLVRAKPVFSAQHGFTLTIDAIDSDYTLGDLEARKREIRARLKKEGLWGRNKSIESPWDFNRVIVLAPRDAAGLGDFQVEALRIQRVGLCTFHYVHSRFQGEGAAAEIVEQARAALLEWERKKGGVLDAIVFIRGGGAVNDLAWLNDFDLAKFVCELSVPVLTGIGHERDSTILDEVANTRFDTPSKVITGIEAVIAKRARTAQAAFTAIADLARSYVAQTSRTMDLARSSVQTNATRQLRAMRDSSDEAIEIVRQRARRTITSASEQTRDLMQEVKGQASTHVALAKQAGPQLLAQVRDRSTARIEVAVTASDQVICAILDRAGMDVRRMMASMDDSLDRLTHDARQGLASASTQAEGLMREISGQGPQKTLARGFAHVRDENGRTVMNASALSSGSIINVTFHDGAVPATVSSSKEKKF